METTSISIEERLNNRELQLIRFLSEGFTRSEIADKMAMSIHTYDGYRKNIRTKLQIRSSADWAKIFYQVA